MKVKQLRLQRFKRFDDLTIDLGEHPARIVALVGPNGCGKSSIFDPFKEKLKEVKSPHRTEPASFFDKFAFHPDEALRNQGYNKNEAITLTLADAGQSITKKTFHIRSAYRFTPSLDVTSISAQPNILDDNRRRLWRCSHPAPVTNRACRGPNGGRDARGPRGWWGSVMLGGWRRVPSLTVGALFGGPPRPAPPAGGSFD